MFVLGKNSDSYCAVDGTIVSVDEVIENAVTHLDYANKSFAYLYELYFGWAQKPKEWDTQYREISVQMTTLKFLFDRITDDLLAAHGMASDYHAAVLSVLHNSARGER